MKYLKNFSNRLALVDNVNFYTLKSKTYDITFVWKLYNCGIIARQKTGPQNAI